jgi:hypothetical protein
MAQHRSMCCDIFRPYLVSTGDSWRVAPTDSAEDGGFKWSSQRLTWEGCDGQAGWVDDGVDGQGAVEVAGGAVVAA